MPENYKNFKHLLEYFVTHLEFFQTGNTNLPGYEKYIAHYYINDKPFKKTGQGYKGGNIQNQIEKWSKYGNGEVCITTNAQKGYTSTGNYLHWHSTWLNIRTEWEHNKIIGLYLTKEEGRYAKPEYSCTLTELELFDKKEPNDSIKQLFNNFEKMLLDYNLNKKLENYTNLLEVNKNLILTGAPGTGKTYLAHQIAEFFGATKENGRCKMVQFHPSYDYTDFVEGLRPIKGDSDTNIGFKRMDGSFKDFCKKAIKNTQNNGVDNFDEAWDLLIEKIDKEGIIRIPTLSGNRYMHIELNDYGTGLTERTYDETEKNRINGASKFFSKEQIRNIYEGRKGTESGGHDSYRKAIINEMKTNFGLKDYVKITDINNPSEAPKYIFIIDEINRGELSKIFGELFFSIDPNYRGKSGLVQTQYQNLITESDIFYDGFYIPENVYIIGTMNDIDRSVETMDFAMRRRFAWKEITASEASTMFESEIPDIKDEATKRMNNLNNAISDIEGLNASYHIGPAYFLKIELYNNNQNNIEDAWESLWNNHLKGLLYEYLRGYEAEEIMQHLENFKKAYELKESEDYNGTTTRL
jgi:hypothetical protein BACCOPRO_00001